jgi:hypothetical protein
MKEAKMFDSNFIHDPFLASEILQLFAVSAVFRSVGWEIFEM